MSQIYINEPPTTAKVCLKTTAGDIDIELWTREAPKTRRNFIQLCLEGYYDNTIFHRVVKDFIVQGGDPTGTGTAGESIYGQPFKVRDFVCWLIHHSFRRMNFTSGCASIAEDWSAWRKWATTTTPRSSSSRWRRRPN